MSAETIDSMGVEITRDEPREYRKVATVRAGPAIRGGTMPTLEGPHSFEAGDYICGPGAGGEFWPVKRAIFEATYVPTSEAPSGGLDPERLARAIEAVIARTPGLWLDYSRAANKGTITKSRKAFARQLTREYARISPTPGQGDSNE